MAQTIKAFAPATVANVACGFDVLGFAVEYPGDEVVLTVSEGDEIKINSIQGDEGKLPLDPDQNTISLVIKRYLEHIGEKRSVHIDLKKLMPLKSGLGSSAASSVVGAYALNKFLGSPLADKDLLPFAMEGERLACGSAHADNVAPALYGGFVLVRSYSPLDVVQLPTPEKLHATIVHPKIEVKTQDARNILRREVQLKDAIIQWGNLGGFVAGLYQSDYGLIGRSLQDAIIEPIRSILIPGFYKVKNAAMAHGALGCSISGSGPSIFALSTDLSDAKRIGEAMKKEFDKINIESTVYVSKVSNQGPRIIE